MESGEEEERDDNQPDPKQDEARNGSLARQCGGLLSTSFFLYFWSGHARDMREDKFSRWAGRDGRRAEFLSNATS